VFVPIEDMLPLNVAPFKEAEVNSIFRPVHNAYVEIINKAKQLYSLFIFILCLIGIGALTFGSWKLWLYYKLNVSQSMQPSVVRLPSLSQTTREAEDQSTGDALPLIEQTTRSARNF